MSDQKDVFEIIARIDRKIAEREELESKPPAPELQLQEVELEEPGESFPCSGCGRFHFHQLTTCYWCQPREPS